MRTALQMNQMNKALGWTDLACTDVKGAKVLIVDDDPLLCRTLQRMITEFGYGTRTTSSAEEADQLMTNIRFDVVILDVKLPRMNGPEFLTWALARDPQLAVILLTGLDNPELAIECLQNGARTYFVKPVDPAFIRHALCDAVAVRRLLIEHNESFAVAKLQSC